MKESIDAIAKDLRLSEEALLTPSVRKDRARIEELLAEDFLEFGASGRAWTRDEIRNLLAAETCTPVQMEDFNCALLAGDVALVTYRAVRTEGNVGMRNSTLRSSIWTKRSGRWRLRFHQGTRIP